MRTGGGGWEADGSARVPPQGLGTEAQANAYTTNHRARRNFVAAAAAGFTALSGSRGQEPPAVPGPAAPATPTRAAPAEAKRPARDLTRLSNLQRQLYLSAQRGADWLQRANRPDGRFIYGYVPALRTPLEGDHYLRQAGAAFAVARAARFFGDDRAAIRN